MKDSMKANASYSVLSLEQQDETMRGSACEKTRSNGIKHCTVSR